MGTLFNPLVATDSTATEKLSINLTHLAVHFNHLSTVQLVLGLLFLCTLFFLSTATDALRSIYYFTP